MSNRNLLVGFLIVVAWVALIFIGMLLMDTNAHAHAQVYPHTHPHHEPGGFADMVLALLFIYGTAGAWVLVSRLAKRSRRERK